MKKCFLCGVSDNNVVDFDEQTFAKCCRIIAFRKKKNHVYGENLLANEAVSKIGRHVNCYKKVTVLKQKFKEEFADYCTSLQQKEEKESNDYIPGSTIVQTNLIKNEESSKKEPVPMEIDDSVTENSQGSSGEKKIPRTRRKCLFCNAAEVRVGSERTYVTISNSLTTIARLKNIATISEDAVTLQKVESCEEIAYHPTCYTKYGKKSRAVSVDEENDDSWHIVRDVHKNAFKAIEKFIRDEIIVKESVYYMSDIYAQYKALFFILFFEIGGDKVLPDHLTPYRIDKLEMKIRNTFFDEVTIELSLEQHSKKIIYKNDLDVTKLAEAVVYANERQKFRVKELGYEIRRSILSANTKKLPNNNLSLEDVKHGECQIPWFLYELISEIVRGPNPQRTEFYDDTVKIKSLCSDLMFVASRGRLKPAKNIMLGHAMKSLTGSRMVLTTLNRYGHCISYTGVEEIETELTYTAVNENAVIPSGIILSPNLCTNVAFDNFDCFVDTANGKDTLHDTVGIIYQFVPNKDQDDHIVSHVRRSLTSQDRNIESLSREPSRKRRRFDEISRDVRPYLNNRYISEINLLSSNAIFEVIQDCRVAKNSALQKDLLWVVLLSQSDSTPMWLGFNAKYYVDDSERQVVDYLQPINKSPTSFDVIHETLLRAKQIAEECRQSEIICTFDLAIAKIAMAIQRNLSPEFDNIFINLGAFHFEMAYFKAIGKFIDSCGISDILLTSEVLAQGSLNGFLDCKHFNRCKKIHPLLLGALRTLHFQRFTSEKNLDLEVLQDDLKEFFSISADIPCNKTLPPSLNDILREYGKFCDLTITGKHGKTAQFYMTYMSFIEAFLRLSRSIRCNDFELYLYSIFEMTNLFFVMNQPNYARYSLLYVSNLMKLKLSDSNLILAFRRGAFGIKRTNKNFGRSPVDLTLEQTINADAANTSTGVIHFTNSIGARQRWAISHSIRTKIISEIKSDLNLSLRDDVSYSLQKSRLESDRKNLKSIIEAIKNTINPFNSTLDQNQLFNISTGKAASSNVVDFLLNVYSVGEEQKESFINACNENGSRFTKPIKRNTILNFASDCAKTVQKNRNNSKHAIIKMERDIFGRLLAIALEKNIDIEFCLSFPLAPAPPALFQCSGDMFKTNKAVLASEVKSKVDLSYPDRVDVVIVDGFYFLHSLGSSVPSSFEKISRTVLTKLCTNNASEIHLIFDRYLIPSIKDCERLNRQEQDIPYCITGPQQTRPTDFHKSLKNYRFKEALVQFLAEHWADPSLAQIYGEKKVYITVDEKCFCFYSENNCIIKQEQFHLQCQHEEADTRIAYHISFVNPDSNILIKANDTDVLIILLGNMQKFASKGLKIWLEDSSGKKNAKDCIDCSELACRLGFQFCGSLPGFHAYTGCDYTAAFYLKGKKRPLRLLTENVKFQELFTSLNNPSDIFNDEKIELIQEFTCLMYGVKKCCNVNLARLIIFQKTYSSRKTNEKLLKKIKGFDSTQIPPCWRSLKQKILRTIYVTSMWQNVTRSTCTLFKPEECGWKRDGILKPIWFAGEPSPLNVEDVLKVDSDPNDEDESDIDIEPASSDSETE